MTSRQWEKIRLRLSQLLKEKNGIVQVALVERLDGTIQMQVVGGKTESIN